MYTMYKLILFVCRPKYGPLFYLELVLDQDGSHYSCDLKDFETMLVSVFDRGIQATQSVPQLEKVNQQFIIFYLTFFLHFNLPLFCSFFPLFPFFFPCLPPF